MRPGVAAMLAIACYLAAMAAFFLLWDPYTADGQDVLPPLEFDQVNLVDPWQLSPSHALIDSGALVLGAGTGQRDGGTLTADLDDPTQYRALRVTASVRMAGIRVGEYGWNTARLILYFTDAENHAHWDHKHAICQWRGRDERLACDAVIDVPSFARKAHLFVANVAAAGTMWVDSIRVAAVEPKPSAARWKQLFTAGWCLCALTSGALLIYPLSRQRLLLLLVAAAIITGVLAPNGAITTIGRGILARLPTSDAPTSAGTVAPAATSTPPGASTTPVAPIAPVAPTTPGVSTTPSATTGRSTTTASRTAALVDPNQTIRSLKKCGHLALFAVLGACALQLHRKGRCSMPLPGVIGALLLFSAGTEIGQFLTSTRSPLFADFVIDGSGATIGLVWWWAVVGGE